MPGVRVARRLKLMTDAIVGGLAIGLLKLIRLFGPDAMSNLGGRLMRWVGPWLPEHRVGRDNLKAAFPEKTDAEIEEILLGVWDNLGRVGAEFAHIDRLWDYDQANPQHGRIMNLADDIERAERALASGRPLLCFSAHLANWELAAVGCHQFGVHSTLLYRRPNNRTISNAVLAIRSGCMGTLVPTDLSAPLKLAETLQRGSHVGMLVDQYYSRGVPVTFFGRRTLANPLIARLARNTDCAICGVRVIRYPGNRFDVQMTDEIPPVRDAEGRVDIERTMQTIIGVIEGWIREHPEQWLWVHRRWRDE